MSINYSNLFTDIGRVVKQFNLLSTQGQAYFTALAAIQSSASVPASFVDAFPGLYNTLAGDYGSLRSSLAQLVQNRFTDYDTVVGPGGLDLSTLDFPTVMNAFYEQMEADSQTIKASVVTIGSVTPNGGNVGNGTVLTTSLLDGVTSPGSREGTSLVAHYLNANRLTELIEANSETHTVRVTADSYSDALAEGSENLNWSGDLPDDQFGIAANEGTGQIATLTAIHGNTTTYIQNPDFETYTVTNIPNSWTIDLGVVTTNVKKSTGANAYHGTNGVNLLGDGSTAAIQISQPVTRLVPLRMYCVTLRLKADATIGAGALLVNLQGAGYTSTENISIAHGSLPTSWTLEKFFVLIPSNAPSTVKLVINWSGTPTSAKNLYIDDIGIDAVNYGAGFGLMVVRGSTPFVRNDRFTFSTSSVEGVAQKFMRRSFGRMLPSNAVGSETISDSLFT